MRALIVNCTLKPSPEKSNTEGLANVVAEALRGEGVEVASIRAVGHSIPPGVESEVGEGDAWPGIRSQILASEIFIVATPTWLGRPSSIAQRVLERMDAMLSETDDEERPVAYNRVAGVVVTGNEDGAHHVISEISEEGHGWSHATGRAAAANLLAVARALQAQPIPAPPSG